MLKMDYHLHTKYSHDSDAEMEEMVKRAIELQLTEIAVTEHVDYCYTTLNHLNPIDYGQYRIELENLREKYSDKIHLTFGIEVGVGSKITDEISSFINSQPFDFVIGSQHECDGIDLYYPDFYLTRSKEDAYMQYFMEHIDTVKKISGFHIVGHLDYIERYGQYADRSLKYADFSDIIDLLLKTIIECGKGIEINTSGIRYQLGHTHPHFDIIKRYRQLGGEIITVGSDAHKPDDIAAHFDIAYQYLTELGFKAVTVFRDRKPIMVDI